MNHLERFGIFCVGTALLWGWSGCGPAKVVTRPREDQALAGNRGYLLGTPPPSERSSAPTRTYYETEVEVPTIEMNMRLPQWHREWVDKDLSGNRGYLMGGPYQKQATKAEPVSPAPAQRSSWFRPGPLPVAPEKPVVETGTMTYGTYTVKKGDTLGTISARPEIYGTSRSWKRIYEANQDALKDPNKLKVGQVLRIPRGGGPRKVSTSETIK